MKISSSSIFAIALGSIALVQINAARACDWASSAGKLSALTAAPGRSAVVHFAAYHPGADAKRLTFTDADADANGSGREQADIVGMWRFEMLGPNNVLVDDGYAQWHSDGTELQNSGVHAPIGGNFCMGVWKQTGPQTYVLNHFPLAWESTGQASAVAVQLTETVKLVDHDHLTGTFTLKAYPWDSTKGLTVSGPAYPTVTGTVTGQRVTITTLIPGAP